VIKKQSKIMKAIKHLLLLCFLLCFAEVSVAQERDKIVVGFFRNEDISESLLRVFMNHLTQGLNQSGRYEVLANRRNFAAMQGEEASFQNQGFVNDKELLELGRAAGAAYAGYVEINEFDGLFFITCHVTDLKTGAQAATFNLDAERRDLPDAARRLANMMATGRNIAAQPVLRHTIAPMACFDQHLGRFVDCEISRTDEEPLSLRNATDFCRNKGDGWRLPTREELGNIYRNRHQIVENQGAPFTQRDYWSSTRHNNHESFVVNFATGRSEHYSSNIRNVFRCVRHD
jgi:hypothetical protein